MAETRYRAVVDLRYPAPGSLKAVQAAGGLSKMSESARAKVVIKTVRAGQYADNIPASSVKWLLKGGMIRALGATAVRAKGTVKR
jgi:hypothetical protein